MPEERTVAEKDNDAQARLGGGFRPVRISLVQSSKVCINIAIQVKLASGFDNSSLVKGASKVTDNGLDGRGMRFLGVVSKASNLDA